MTVYNYESEPARLSPAVHAVTPKLTLKWSDNNYE